MDKLQLPSWDGQSSYLRLTESLELARRRRTARWLAKWAVIRLGVMLAIGAWTGYYDLALAGWAVLTMGHIDHCIERP